jgi:hypothetical protein
VGGIGGGRGGGVHDYDYVHDYVHEYDYVHVCGKDVFEGAAASALESVGG